MATEQDIIKDAQETWANSNEKRFDSKGYVDTVEDNLRKCLSDSARKAFERGAGSEPKKHMRALHSSSALAANFFDYWTDRNKISLLRAMGIDADSAKSLNFEAQFPTRLGGTPPHLDVAIKLNSCCTVAIECKFTEPFQRSTKGKSEFVKSYFPSSGGLWTQVGLPECQRLAEELCKNPRMFEYLDPGQLLKHALGLATQVGDQFSLYYLYYDGIGERSESHKKEVVCFNDRVGDEIRFKALTYQDVFCKIKESEAVDPEYREYLDYLGARYFNSHSLVKR